MGTDPRDTTEVAARRKAEGEVEGGRTREPEIAADRGGGHERRQRLRSPAAPMAEARS
jgi:hypothetical protein